MVETITITKKEYERLKKKAREIKIDEDIKKSFEDIKNGRVIRVR